jgi:hypothetical protein
MPWLQLAAGVFLGIAGLVSAARFKRSRNYGQLVIACCFLLASAIFMNLALTAGILRNFHP